MDRTSAPNNVLVSGRRMYRDRNWAAGEEGTSLMAADRNAVQEEILAVIEAAGLTPSASNLAQLLAALRLMTRGMRVVVTSSQTVTAPVWATRAFIRAWGGGGAGGGSTGSNGAGAGGGGGEYREALATVTPGAAYAVTVGAGGVAGTGAGTNGGDSIFAEAEGATLALAKGGGGGGAGVNTPSLTFGSGGTGGLGGALSIRGQNGGTEWRGMDNTRACAQGGGAFGGAPTPLALSPQASLGIYPGGGGSGGFGGTEGGPGAYGLLTIEWRP
ncbi:glycine-rich domain-containing protein [Teichococcus cervicalis]|nr:hypothetical protein [Pseudoroseomonas cervicalis]